MLCKVGYPNVVTKEGEVSMQRRSGLEEMLFGVRKVTKEEVKPNIGNKRKPKRQPKSKPTKSKPITTKSILDEVYVTSEVSAYYPTSYDKLRKAINRGEFDEYIKKGLISQRKGTWLWTKEALDDYFFDK